MKIKNFLKNNGLYILIGLGVLLFFGFANKILQFLGFKDSKEETERKNKLKKALSDGAKIYSNQKMSYDNSVYVLIANQIYNDWRFSAISDNDNDAIKNLQKMKNNLDLAILSKEFGFRREYWFGIPIGDEMDLATFASSNLSYNELNEVNNNFKKSGITVRF